MNYYSKIIYPFTNMTKCQSFWLGILFVHCRVAFDVACYVMCRDASGLCGIINQTLII